ncbi:MAG: cation transporter [Ignavibacteria bacterium]|nr:cation transporter [Ignavibacteria bacterium]
MLLHVHTHHGDPHGDGHHIHEHRDIKPLRIAIVLTTSIFIIQVFGGLYSGSLALLSDAGHVLVDLASLLIAFFGLRIAAKAREHHDIRYTFGLRRIEILAALTNGFLLVGVCIYIMIEAVRRLASPHHVHAESMLAVAVIGFIANGISALYLHKSEHITTRSAYLHVMTDLMSSGGVILAAILLGATGWDWIDPAISLAIALLIMRGAFKVIHQSSVILMESAPAHINPTVVEGTVQQIEGVMDAHDVHVWQLGSNNYNASVHVVTNEAGDEIVRAVQEHLRDEYGVQHTTVQIESAKMNEDGDCGAC